MDYLRGCTPHTPRQIPTSYLSSQTMTDVVAVLSSPFFFLSDAHFELSKRKLKPSGRKDALLRRLFDALETEYADGWTLGYLLDTKILPFHSKGRDPRRLIGHHVEGYTRDGNGNLTLELSDGEDVTLVSSNKSSDDDASTMIKMDHDLFWALHTLDGINAVPRDLARKPLLITDAVTGVRKDRWGKEAGSVVGLKLEGMRTISFFFLAGKAYVREDRVGGHVWMAENEVLRVDMRVLHGGGERGVREMNGTWMMEDGGIGLEEEDLRGLHG